MSDNKPEKPKILGPKPTIANKPKFIPPVNLKLQPQQQQQQQHQLHHYQQQSSTQPHPAQKRPPMKCEDVSYHQQQAQFHHQLQHDKVHSVIQRPCSFNQDCIKKAPNSPSTVCCSILSNTAQDCCGVIKDLNGKQLCKNESLDSNSSDSGGFKDFIQLDLTKDVPKHHQRQISQPDFNKLLIAPQGTHQRKTSDYSYNYEKQSIATNVQHQQQQQSQHHAPHYNQHQPLRQSKPYVANAQALTPYLNQTQDKLLKIDSTDGEMLPPPPPRQINKLNLAQASQLFSEKTDVKPKQPAPLISQGQFQQSTKKLEEMLSQRIGGPIKKGPTCLIEGESSDTEQKLLVQKQFQQKLQADLQQTVKHIQEKQSIEYRLPQNRKWNEVGSWNPYWFGINIIYYYKFYLLFFTGEHCSTCEKEVSLKSKLGSIPLLVLYYESKAHIFLYFTWYYAQRTNGYQLLSTKMRYAEVEFRKCNSYCVILLKIPIHLCNANIAGLRFTQVRVYFRTLRSIGMCLYTTTAKQGSGYIGSVYC